MEEENQYSISTASEDFVSPDILDASNITSSSFTVNWISNNPNQNLFYEIFCTETATHEGPFDDYFTWGDPYTDGECIGSTSVRSTSITGLKSATYYNIMVCVYNEEGYGLFTYMTYYVETLSGGSGEEPPADIYEYPTILAVKDIAEDSFTMSWIPNNIGITLSYKLEYKKSSQTSWGSAAWTGNIIGSSQTSTKTFTDLEPSTSYDVRVTITDKNNHSFPTVWENYATTLAGVSEGVIFEAPTMLEATNIKRTSLTVNWKMNNSGVKNIVYQILYKSPTDSDWQRSKAQYYDGGSTTRSLTLTGLVPGTEYTIQVVINKGSTTKQSWPPIYVSTLGGYGDLEPPTILATTDVTGSSFTVNWKMNNIGIKDITWVVIVYSESGIPMADEEGIALGGTNGSCVITNMPPNSLYQITVELRKDGYTSASAKSTVTTGDLESLQEPSIQLPIVVDGGKITVNWITNNDLQVDYEFYVNDIKKSEACGTVSSANGSEIRTNTFYVDHLETTYRLKIVIKYKGYADSYTEQDFTSGTLTRWEWNATEIDAFTNHKSFFLLTAIRWRDFINKYNSVMYQAQGMGVVDAGNYLVESAYIAVEKGSPLTANDFNSITRQIEGCLKSAATIKGTQSPYTRPTDRTAGVDIVYGHYFTDLSDGVNWLIDILLNN